MELTILLSCLHTLQSLTAELLVTLLWTPPVIGGWAGCRHSQWLIQSSPVAKRLVSRTSSSSARNDVESRLALKRIWRIETRSRPDCLKTGVQKLLPAGFDQEGLESLIAKLGQTIREGLWRTHKGCSVTICRSIGINFQIIVRKKIGFSNVAQARLCQVHLSFRAHLIELNSLLETIC